MKDASWDDAKQYVAWIAKVTGKPYRLLTERNGNMQRAPELRRRIHGATRLARAMPTAMAVAASGTCKPLRSAHPRPNAFGLYDMHGNVSEWVEDCYNGNYNGAPTDGSAWTIAGCDQRVVRGGSWNNYPEILRSASRLRGTSVSRFNNLGFRVGRTLTP